MEEDKKEKIRKVLEKTILDMSEMVNNYKLEIKETTEAMNALKEEIRGLMVVNILKHVKNEVIEVKMSIPHSFDVGMLKYAHPELAAKFVKTVTTTTTVTTDEISKEDKKILKEEYPEVWKEINPEGTPRLTIKRL